MARRQRPRVDGTHMSFGALGAARPVPVETFHPEILNALVNPPSNQVQVIPSTTTTTTNTTATATGGGAQQVIDLPRIYLMRQDSSTCTEAYALVPGKKSVKIDHHFPNWGEVFFAIIYRKVAPGVFQAPEPSQAEWVAIKRLNKQAVTKYMQKGGEENPYKEISRMRELGDDQHVLKCRDALQDDTYLYIVTRKGECTLVDLIPFVLDGSPSSEQQQQQQDVDTQQAHYYFVQLLQILQYLEQHGISHRDFSPDNFLILPGNNLVAFDLALSHRVPVDPNTGLRTLAHSLGNFGTRAYMSPEIYSNRPFCGLYADLWSAAVVLYNLLTHEVLYYMPHPNDLSFRYNVLAGGLSSVPINERTIEVLQELQDRPDGAAVHQGLFRRAMAHLRLTPEATELLEHLLALAPTERWSLGQAMESAYVRGGGEGGA